MQLRTDFGFKLSLVATLACSSLLLAACGDDDDDNGLDTGDAAVDDAGAGTGGTGGRAGTGGDGAGRGGRGGEGGSPPDGEDAGIDEDAGATNGGEGDPALSDPEIAGVISAANTGEVEQGQFALLRANQPAVRQYGQRMVNEHSAANRMLGEVLNELNLTVAPSALSEQLTMESQQIVMELESVPEDQFDREYMTAQRAIHARVLALIEETLLPSAQAARMEAYLMQARTTVAAHLREAELILESLPETE